MINPYDAIVTYEDYKSIIGIPHKAQDNEDTRNRYTKWINQATDQFDSLISGHNELGRLYRWVSNLNLSNREDLYRKYKLVKAICSWVETFVLNGKLWVDGVPAINSNINIDVQTSSDNGFVESKRKDIIQDLVSLGLYQTTNLINASSVSEFQIKKDIEEILIFSKSYINDHYLNLTPQTTLKGPLDLANNQINNGGNIIATPNIPKPYIDGYEIRNATLDFNKNNMLNIVASSSEHANYADTAIKAMNADNALQAQNAVQATTALRAERVLDRSDNNYKYIDDLDISTWDGMTKEEIYSAVYSAGMEWDPDFPYKKGFIAQEVDNRTLKIKYYRAIKDSVGKEPAVSPQYWQELTVPDIDVNAMMHQLEQYAENILEEEVPKEIGKWPNLSFTSEFKDEVLLFKNEEDFQSYLTISGLTADAFEDVNLDIPDADEVTQLRTDVTALQTSVGTNTTDLSNLKNKDFALRNETNTFGQVQNITNTLNISSVLRGLNFKKTVNTEIALTWGDAVDNSIIHKVSSLGDKTLEIFNNAGGLKLNSKAGGEGSKIDIITRDITMGYGTKTINILPDDNSIKTLIFASSATKGFNLDFKTWGNIYGLPTPTKADAAANKGYVDDQITQTKEFVEENYFHLNTTTIDIKRRYEEVYVGSVPISDSSPINWNVDPTWANGYLFQFSTRHGGIVSSFQYQSTFVPNSSSHNTILIPVNNTDNDVYGQGAQINNNNYIPVLVGMLQGVGFIRVIGGNWTFKGSDLEIEIYKIHYEADVLPKTKERN